MDFEAKQTIKDTEKAKVYLALNDEKKLVIVKELKAAQATVFKKLQELQSGYFPKIMQVMEDSNRLTVMEEFINGATLRDYLDSENTDLTLYDEEKIDMLIGVCEALELLHTCEPPIIHRDIKPTNILLTADLQVKIIDFDASRQYKKDFKERDTVLMVTEGYAPPEQYGSEQTDGRADIYALGKVMQEMAILQETPHSTRVERVTEKACKKDPDSRYRTIQELKKELEKIKRQAFEKKRRKSGLLIGAAVVLLSVLMGGAIFFGHLLSDKGNIKSELTETVCYVENADDSLEIKLREDSEKKIVALYDSNYEQLKSSQFLLSENGKVVVIKAKSGLFPGEVYVLLDDGTLCDLRILMKEK